MKKELLFSYMADNATKIAAPTSPLSSPLITRSIFQGIKVQSEHLPILHEVYTKYGDVFEGSILRSWEAKAMALSCLANILIILQTPAEGFSDDQVAYMESTLADLQFMRLKIGWLVPFVEPILPLHKQLQDDLASLEEAKAKVEKAGERLFALRADVKQGLDIDVMVGEEALAVCDRYIRGK